MQPRSLWTFVLIVLAVVLGLGLLAGRTAPMPDVFGEGLTLPRAAELSSETGKPILVVATADWCAPCQTLKRRTLSDPQTAAWIGANTIPVYLEDGEHRQQIQDLGVGAYPTTMLLVRGRVVAGASGAMGPDDFMRIFGNAASAPEPAYP